METTTAPPDHFPRNLRRAMDEAGVKAGELAEATGVSRPTVSDWRHGKASPQVRLLPTIAQVCATTPERLVADPDLSMVANELLQRIPTIEGELSRLAQAVDDMTPRAPRGDA